MIKNYFLVALRSLGRNKLHASINILGLAIGMTCCILIALFVQYELSYDRHNKLASRIYRMGVDLEANNWAISAFPIGALLKDNFAEIENFTRIRPVEAWLLNASTVVKNKERVFYADSSVFDVLDIALIEGDPTKALAQPNSMVLTPEKARVYFGDADPIGKTLTLLSDKQEYQVTGIFKPLPSNTHVHMDVMISSWNLAPMRPGSPDGWNYLTGHYTYLVLPEGIDHLAFEKQISTFMDKFTGVQPGERGNVIRLDPLTSIHLFSNKGYEIEANGSMSTVYIFAAIAFFILIIACINFMNLSTAQSLRRAREVGMRKVVGGNKSQLIVQFISESVLISIIALVISIVLLILIVPQFNEITEKQLVINPLENRFVFLAFLSITLFAGLFAGIYPAFFLSAFKPALVLKGNFASNLKGQLLRKSLVVIQFAVAFVIMVGTYIVYSQLTFMRTKDMGFDRAQTLILKLPQDSIGEQTIKEEFKRVAGVRNASSMAEVPGKMVQTANVWYENAKENKPENVYTFSGDPELVETLGMRLKAGSFFNKDTKRFYKEFVINETAAKRFGWTAESAIGKLMQFGARGDDPGKVVGVVKDFHYKHLHDAIGPLVMYLEPHRERRFMALKLESGDVREIVPQIEQTWKRILPNHEFEYSFLDDSFDKLFNQEKKLAQLFAVFSGLAIFISCLGLFGLASFTLEQSRKSVAVRKVLGASVPGIILMMSRDFLKLVAIGMLIASPLAWWAMNKWLNGFAYNVGFSWIVFLYAAVAGLTIAFITVSYHSFTAAASNPVKTLKES